MSRYQGSRPSPYNTHRYAPGPSTYRRRSRSPDSASSAARRKAELDRELDERVITPTTGGSGGDDGRGSRGFQPRTIARKRSESRKGKRRDSSSNRIPSEMDYSSEEGMVTPPQKHAQPQPPQAASLTAAANQLDRQQDQHISARLKSPTPGTPPTPPRVNLPFPPSEEIRRLSLSPTARTSINNLAERLSTSPNRNTGRLPPSTSYSTSSNSVLPPTDIPQAPTSGVKGFSSIKLIDRISPSKKDQQDRPQPNLTQFRPMGIMSSPELEDEGGKRVEENKVRSRSRTGLPLQSEQFGRTPAGSEMRRRASSSGKAGRSGSRKSSGSHGHSHSRGRDDGKGGGHSKSPVKRRDGVEDSDIDMDRDKHQSRRSPYRRVESGSQMESPSPHHSSSPDKYNRPSTSTSHSKRSSPELRYPERQSYLQRDRSRSPSPSRSSSPPPRLNRAPPSGPRRRDPNPNPMDIDAASNSSGGGSKFLPRRDRSRERERDRDRDRDRDWEREKDRERDDRSYITRRRDETDNAGSGVGGGRIPTGPSSSYYAGAGGSGGNWPARRGGYATPRGRGGYDRVGPGRDDYTERDRDRERDTRTGRDRNIAYPPSSSPSTSASQHQPLPSAPITTRYKVPPAEIRSRAEVDAEREAEKKRLAELALQQQEDGSRDEDNNRDTGEDGMSQRQNLDDRNRIGDRVPPSGPRASRFADVPTRTPGERYTPRDRAEWRGDERVPSGPSTPMITKREDLGANMGSPFVPPSTPTEMKPEEIRRQPISISLKIGDRNNASPAAAIPPTTTATTSASGLGSVPASGGGWNARKLAAAGSSSPASVGNLALPQIQTGLIAGAGPSGSPGTPMTPGTHGSGSPDAHGNVYGSRATHQTGTKMQQQQQQQQQYQPRGAVPGFAAQASASTGGSSPAAGMEQARKISGTINPYGAQPPPGPNNRPRTDSHASSSTHQLPLPTPIDPGTNAGRPRRSSQAHKDRGWKNLPVPKELEKVPRIPGQAKVEDSNGKVFLVEGREGAKIGRDGWENWEDKLRALEHQRNLLTHSFQPLAASLRETKFKLFEAENSILGLTLKADAALKISYEKQLGYWSD